VKFILLPPPLLFKIDLYLYLTSSFLFVKLNKQTMKYIIYERKSTESEERQVLSIETQLAELREFEAKIALLEKNFYPGRPLWRMFEPFLKPTERPKSQI